VDWSLLVKTVLRWLDLVVYLAFLAFAVVTGPRVTPWYVGLALSAVSVPFWFVARWQLGRSFSVTAQARQLVTSGLYSKLRHPVYVFGSLGWFGALLALLGWRAVMIWLIVVVVEIGRARREERVLAETFSAEYEAYRGRTWF
jgi:protein-S-isoprenylcysteine O-methyltransferase Ste14